MNERDSSRRPMSAYHGDSWDCINKTYTLESDSSWWVHGGGRKVILQRVTKWTRSFFSTSINVVGDKWVEKSRVVKDPQQVALSTLIWRILTLKGITLGIWRKVVELYKKFWPVESTDSYIRGAAKHRGSVRTSNPADLGSIISIPEILVEFILNIAEIYWQHRLESSVLGFNNVDWTHLVLQC